MCALDFPVFEHSCQPVSRCLRALLLYPSVVTSPCLLWFLEYILQHSALLSPQSKSIQEFLLAATALKNLLLWWVSLCVYL